MSNLAFYGNSEGSEVFAIDIDSMILLCRIPTGAGPYPVDAVGSTHVLASTRKEKSVTPIDIASLSPLPKIVLPHKPRSSSTHNNGFILISGADNPLITVVDSKTWRPLRTFGDEVAGSVDDFGGKLASGHERWLPDGDRFFLIDRVRRKINLWRLSTAELLWSINTPTSCHHVVPDPDGSGAFYAMCEGNAQAKTPPSIMKIVPAGDIFSIEAQVFLPILTGMLSSSGSHHVDVNGDFIYAGSNEGHTYVFHKPSLSLETVIPTGGGNGHTGFIQYEGRNLGVTINHTAQFVTVFEIPSHQRVADIQVSQSTATPSRRTQAHTTGKRGHFFYMMASLDATFHEIDIVSGAINRSLRILPKDENSPIPFPMQGVFMWNAPGAVCTQCS